MESFEIHQTSKFRSEVYVGTVYTNSYFGWRKLSQLLLNLYDQTQKANTGLS